MWRDALAIPGALSELECDVLASLARQTKATSALEVGHFYGRSTVVLLTSLPAACGLTTVDHHHGDLWACATDVESVRATLLPHVSGRAFRFLDEDMLAARYVGPYGFVFYDADHSADAVSAWWATVEPFLAPGCTLVFDDADWDGQQVLTGLSEAAGFRSTRVHSFFRCPDRDKRNPETYTLEVMRRDA